MAGKNNIDIKTMLNYCTMCGSTLCLGCSQAFETKVQKNQEILRIKVMLSDRGGILSLQLHVPPAHQ